jgi:hypothetical protein
LVRSRINSGCFFLIGPAFKIIFPPLAFPFLIPKPQIVNLPIDVQAKARAFAISFCSSMEMAYYRQVPLRATPGSARRGGIFRGREITMMKTAQKQSSQSSNQANHGSDNNLLAKYKEVSNSMRIANEKPCSQPANDNRAYCSRKPC